jgi:anti-sigma B factor antagonist
MGRCEVREQDGFGVLAVSGEVDLSWSPDLRRDILAQLEAGKPVLVDLSQVTYIDSSGIAGFVEGYQRAKALKLQFGLLSASEPVLSVLRLARLDRVFPMHADLAAAQAAAPRRKGKG